MTVYNSIELSDIPDDWEIKKLGDIVDNFDKKRKPISGLEREKIKGEYPYCGANGIVDYINSYALDGDYVLLAEDGGYWGKCEKSSYLMTGKFWVNNHAHIIAAKNGLTNNYFLMCMLNFLNIDPFIGGDARGKLTQAIMNSLAIPLPPIIEQQNISNILSRIQATIETQESIIQTTIKFRQALMQKLFTEGMNSEEQKETEIGLIPRKWDVVTVGELIVGNMQNGAFIQKPKYGNGVLYVNVEDIYENAFINYERLKRIDVPLSLVKNYLLQENDIVFVRSSLKREGIGQCCLIADIKEPIFYDCHLIKISPDTQKVIPQYLVYYWRSNLGKTELIRRSKTTTMTTINQQGLSQAMLPLPDKKEQVEICNVLTTVDIKIEIALKKRNLLQSLFNSMLKQLMSGQTRVKDLSL